MIEHQSRENSGWIKSRFTVKNDRTPNNFSAIPPESLDKMELVNVDLTEPSEFLSDHPVVVDFLQQTLDQPPHPNMLLSPNQQQQQQQPSAASLVETVRMLVVGLHLVQEDLRRERSNNAILANALKMFSVNAEIRLRANEDLLGLRTNGAFIPCRADLLDDFGKWRVVFFVCFWKHMVFCKVTTIQTS